MIYTACIDLVYGGGSSATPTRDYVVVGGTSSTDERDYLIVLGIGYLPPFPPTTLSFIPPRYGVTKTYAMSGSASRRLMCSKPSSASLTLEYENISDQIANKIDEAYKLSSGTFHGFKLPPAVVSSASSDLLSYMRLCESSNHWYYEDKPVIQSVIKGVSTVSVQLKSYNSVS